MVLKYIRKHFSTQDRFETSPLKRFPNVSLFMRGMKMYYVQNALREKPYNYYNRIFMVVGAYILTKLIGHYYFKTEFHMEKSLNPFMPRIVYKVRRRHYVFWEISRVARGLPKTFTYSTWDPESVSTFI